MLIGRFTYAPPTGLTASQSAERFQEICMKKRTSY